jgi:hypothetical protein
VHHELQRRAGRAARADDADALAQQLRERVHPRLCARRGVCRGVVAPVAGHTTTRRRQRSRRGGRLTTTRGRYRRRRLATRLVAPAHMHAHSTSVICGVQRRRASQRHAGERRAGDGNALPRVNRRDSVPVAQPVTRPRRHNQRANCVLREHQSTCCTQRRRRRRASRSPPVVRSAAASAVVINGVG